MCRGVARPHSTVSAATTQSIRAEFSFVESAHCRVSSATCCARCPPRPNKSVACRDSLGNVSLALSPRASAKVLCCRLLPAQLDAYRAFLSSDARAAIVDGKLNLLYGVDTLRKICNHPDLLLLKRREDERAVRCCLFPRLRRQRLLLSSSFFCADVECASCGDQTASRRSR